MSKNNPVFLEHDDGRLFVKLEAVMPPLVAMIDGITLYMTRRTKRSKEEAFLLIDTAIDWCRKEMEYHSREKYQRMIDAMEKVKADAAAERADRERV